MQDEHLKTNNYYENCLLCQVVGDVLALNRIARNLHRRRFENGALRLDNVKLVFRLDAEGNPASCEAHGRMSLKMQNNLLLSRDVFGTIMEDFELENCVTPMPQQHP